MTGLTVSRCGQCGLAEWPPSRFCSRCLSATAEGKADTRGIVVTLTKRDGKYACLADFGGIRLVCTITYGEPRIGGTVLFQRHLRRETDVFEARVADG